MANFQYTYASWDHLRPGTMPKTGLGAALKTYETAKGALERSQIDCVAKYTDATRALGAVESIRAKIVKDYAKNIVFKSAVTALNNAPLTAERQALANILGGHITGILGHYPEDLGNRKRTLETEIGLLEQAVQNEHDKKVQPPKVMSAIKNLVGHKATVVGHFTMQGQNELRSFLGGKNVYRNVLPDQVRECEAVAGLIKEVEDLQAHLNELVRELTPTYGG